MIRVHTPLSILAIAIAVLFITALATGLRFSAPLLLILVGIAVSFVPVVDDAPAVGRSGAARLPAAAALRRSHPHLGHRLPGQPAIRSPVCRSSWSCSPPSASALITWLILPVQFAVAFALGAVVAPPDAVAATSIARRIGLPRRW